MSRNPASPFSEVYGMEPSRPEDYQEIRLDVIRDRWDQKADRWDADLADEHFHLNEDDAYRRFLAATDAVVTDRRDFCRNQTVVDLGCGTGLVLAHLIDRFAAGLGIDISPRMLVHAAERQLPGTRWMAANCFELASHASDAGAVFSRGILLSHYGPRLARLLMEQVRQSLCAQGGFAVFDFLNAAARHRFACNPQNKTYYDAEQINRLAADTGFRRATILGEPNRRVLLLLAEC
jgi:predicted TPR repeat methyltransferase